MLINYSRWNRNRDRPDCLGPSVPARVRCLLRGPCVRSPSVLRLLHRGLEAPLRRCQAADALALDLDRAPRGIVNPVSPLLGSLPSPVEFRAPPVLEQATRAADQRPLNVFVVHFFINRHAC